MLLLKKNKKLYSVVTFFVLLSFASVPISCSLLNPSSSSSSTTMTLTQTAARAVSTLDISAASLVHFLILEHQQGKISRDVLVQYATNIGPKVQTALESARDVLELLAVQGNAPVTNDTSMRFVAAMDLLNKATQLVTSFGTQYGWKL